MASPDLYAQIIDAPFGRFGVAVDVAGALVRATFGRGRSDAAILGQLAAGGSLQLDAERTSTPVAQLREYFAGARHTFDLTLDLRGTPFRCSVWHALLEIPFGATQSYGALAAQIGRPQAARAVGQANHHNPIPIVVPCHRVLGASGALTGFGGGLDAKRWLLRHEGVRPARRQGSLWDGAPPAREGAAR
ncbi:MAG: methylated-DNA--[protein]-cysteine S-methyltransferase [Planctomycetota bacterium]